MQGRGWRPHSCVTGTLVIAVCGGCSETAVTYRATLRAAAVSTPSVKGVTETRLLQRPLWARRQGERGAETLGTGAPGRSTRRSEAARL